MAKAGLTARRAALRLLDAVLQDGTPLSELDGVLEPLAPADRARARRLSTTTLRRIGPADALLDTYLRKPPPPQVRNVLRLAVVELCEDAAAPHGVVDAAVTILGGDRRTAHMRGLANAVLRKVASEGTERWAQLPPGRLPPWLRKRLTAAYGKSAVRAMERVHAQRPPTDITPSGAWRTQEGGSAEPPLPEGARPLPTGSLRLDQAGQVTALRGYEEGAWWVQDAAAAMPVRALGPRPGERLLDLCAAPGGKTMQMADAGSEVTALDLSAERVTRLRANLERTGLSARVLVGDALKFSGGPYDGVLLDAPCSSTGTIRRHPDLPYAKAGQDLRGLLSLQAGLLDRALGLVRPGGRVTYCVCSLLPEEGEQQIRAALDRHPGVRILPPAALSGLDPGWIDDLGGVRLRPDFWADEGGMDGFYFATLSFGKGSAKPASKWPNLPNFGGDTG